MAAAVPLLQRFGNTLRRRQDVVRSIQWVLVAVYICLLIGPMALASPTLARISEIVFWGLWWPGVILSMMLFGQFWCGLFCPDGTLTEFMSRRGRGGKIPAWLRWAGWPLALFSAVTVYEHLVDAYRSAGATLLAVGGMSVLALAMGFAFGRGKRIWCRYACPGSSMFSLLARCAVFHFKVDRAAWDAAPRPQPKSVDCPLLLDVRRLRGNEKCSMCGRCSGHRNAVALAARRPGQELAGLRPEEAKSREAFAILFVLAGLCHGVVHWQGCVLHGWLLAAGAGKLVAALGAMLGLAVVLGGVMGLMLVAGARGDLRRAAHLSYSLIPLAGVGLFLASLEHAFGLLAEAGVDLAGTVPRVRGAFLLAGSAWSLWVGRFLLRRGSGRRGEAVAVVAAVALLAATQL